MEKGFYNEKTVLPFLLIKKKVMSEIYRVGPDTHHLALFLSSRSIKWMSNFYLFYFIFHTGTNESEWALILTAFIYLCETNTEKKKSALFSPDLAVTRAFGHTDFSLVHRSACFVNVLQ